MKMKVIGMLAAFTLAASAAAAQELPRKVDNVEVLDLDGNPAKLPHWGEKNLMIFYVDPDRHKQNNDFTIELEENHRAQGDNIFGFGVMNLKDAPMVPNGMARNMARKRTAKNGATVQTDTKAMRAIPRSMHSTGTGRAPRRRLPCRPPSALPYAEKPTRPPW